MSLRDRLARLRDRIGGVLEDFTNLEVNTIVKPGMTAQKMPSVPHALHDLADDYASYLSQTCGVNLSAFFEVDPQRAKTKKELRAALSEAAPGPADLPFDDDLVTNEWRTFWRLRYAARWAQRQAYDGPDVDLRHMCLTRIKSTCDQLFGLLEQVENELAPADKPPPGATFDVRAAWIEDANKACRVVGLRRTRQELLDRPPEPHDFSPVARTTIRKAWELGLERVLMQTVVQLDGDVMTRLTPDVADGKHRHLNSIHQLGVTTGISVWKLLLDVIDRIARIATK